MRIAQFSEEFTYAYHGISIELYIFSPGFLNIVGSFFNHFPLNFWGGFSKTSEIPVQHADDPARQCNFLAGIAARYASRF